jgi:hypothetical protein
VKIKALASTIQNISSPAKQAILTLIATKTLVLAIGYIVTYLNTGPAPPLAIAMDMFNRWDAPHYVDIAKNWYASNPALDAYLHRFLYPAS